MYTYYVLCTMYYVLHRQFKILSMYNCICMQCMPRVRLLLLCQTFTSSYLHSHQKQGWVDFNTANHHCTVGMDFHKFMSSALAILPKSRITGLPNVSQIKIRIQEYCLAKPPPANKVRFGRLLLVLPAINKFR